MMSPTVHSNRNDELAPQIGVLCLLFCLWVVKMLFCAAEWIICRTVGRDNHPAETSKDIQMQLLLSHWSHSEPMQAKWSKAAESDLLCQVLYYRPCHVATRCPAPSDTSLTPHCCLESGFGWRASWKKMMWCGIVNVLNAGKTLSALLNIGSQV